MHNIFYASICFSDKRIGSLQDMLIPSVDLRLLLTFYLRVFFSRPSTLNVACPLHLCDFWHGRSCCSMLYMTIHIHMFTSLQCSLVAHHFLFECILLITFLFPYSLSNSFLKCSLDRKYATFVIT